MLLAMPMGSAQQKVLLGVGLLGALVAAIVPYFVVPQFDAVFRSFGESLPLFSELYLHHYPAACGCLPLIVLAVWLFWPRRDLRGLAALYAGWGLLTVSVLVMLVAMYYPIFSLSAAS